MIRGSLVWLQEVQSVKDETVEVLDIARTPSSPAFSSYLFKVPQAPLVQNASGASCAVGRTKKPNDLSLKSVHQHLARLQQQKQLRSLKSVGSSWHHGRPTRSRTDRIKFDSKCSPPRDTPSVMRHYDSSHHNGNGHGNGNGNGNGNNNYGSSSFSSAGSPSVALELRMNGF